MDESDLNSALQPQLSRRGKLARGLVAGGAVVFALAIAAASSGLGRAQSAWSQLAQALAPALPRVTITAHQPAQLAASAWQQIALPITGERFFHYATKPFDLATVFVCVGATPSLYGVVAQGPVELWRTRDSGLHWTMLGLPAITGTTCNVHVATDDPRRVAFLAGNYGSGGRACAGAMVYLSDDGGESWVAVPHTSIAPPGSMEVDCDLLVTARHLYFWCSYLNGVQVTLLERSDDDGQTWMRADNGLGSHALFFPEQVSDGETMVMGIIQMSAPAAGSALWVTHDAGRTWRRTGPIPDYALMMLASQRAGDASPTASHPLYGLVEEQIPASLFRLRALQTTDGRHWATLPPLPVPGASARRPGITNALGVDPSGRFLAFGVDPAEGVPADGGARAAVLDNSQWLWAWDPRAQRWETAATPLPRPWPSCSALCWPTSLSWGPGPDEGGNGTYLWVSSGLSADGGLYRIFLPAA